MGRWLVVGGRLPDLLRTVLGLAFVVWVSDGTAGDYCMCYVCMSMSRVLFR